MSRIFIGVLDMDISRPDHRKYLDPQWIPQVSQGSWVIVAGGRHAIKGSPLYPNSPLQMGRKRPKQILEA
ncbi:unnamed protein product [Nezara viridula]|uniref:Uncharacterized protein n=1 Tax=Nezara viridula TaxID=85310 RepID=A0A9P0EBN0_NEZVI|nr:unnamed protein product [Nezara viridula]